MRTAFILPGFGQAGGPPPGSKKPTASGLSLTTKHSGIQNSLPEETGVVRVNRRRQSVFPYAGRRFCSAGRNTSKCPYYSMAIQYPKESAPDSVGGSCSVRDRLICVSVRNIYYYVDMFSENGRGFCLGFFLGGCQSPMRPRKFGCVSVPT